MSQSNFNCTSSQVYQSLILTLNTSSATELQYSDQSSLYFENAASISLEEVTLQYCFSRSLGSTISLKNTKIYVSNSTIQNNRAQNGGVFKAISSSISIKDSNFSQNQADIGGVLYTSENSFIQIYTSIFKNNSATTKAGVINLDSESYFSIEKSTFLENYSLKDSSVFEALGSSQSSNITIRDCTFKSNYAVRNLIRFIYVSSLIDSCTFVDNRAMEQSENLIVGFSNLTIQNSLFDKTDLTRPASEYSSLYGGFIQIILAVDLTIQNTTFRNGMSQQGGAIYLYGISSVRIQSSRFMNNTAVSQGGAIFGANFLNLLISYSDFDGNLALENQGDDIYSSGELASLTVFQSNLSNPLGSQSIFASFLNLNISKSKIFHRGWGQIMTNGGGLQCQSCAQLVIEDSEFKNISSIYGGAVYLENLDSSSTLSGSFQISNSLFQKCRAFAGGSLYLYNAKNLSIIQSTFMNSSASSTLPNSIIPSQIYENSGSGGSIYFTCSDQESQCSLVINSNSSFQDSNAQVSGGAIYWDKIEPIIQKDEVQFSENKALLYGNDIACFGQHLANVSQSQYLYQLSLTSLSAIGESSRLLLNSSKRSLNENSQSNEINSQTLNDLKSGDTLPIQYLAVLDKYGQIVTTDSGSKALVFVNSSFNTAEDAKVYPPKIQGINQFITEAGVFKLQDLEFDATPTQSYQVVIQLSSLDSTKVSNVEFMKASNLTSLDYKINLNLRQCIIGEKFTEDGRCVTCQDNFSLIQQTSPGSCTTCPSDKALCPGGSKLWPLAGYWRSSNISANIYQCLNEDACLGITTTEQELSDQCAVGYQGILCNDCKDNFSRSGNFKCEQCPTKIANGFRLFFICLGIILLMVVMIYTSISGAGNKRNLTSIYLKVMVNHFQLLMMISVFDINWSKEIRSFLNQSDEISTVYTQIFSFDCFINRSQGRQASIESNNVEYRVHYIKMMFLGLLPLLLIFICAIAVIIYSRTCYKSKVKTEYETMQKNTKLLDTSSLIIASVVASLFLAHPSIVQYMFENFRCKEIEGDSVLIKDMQILCWKNRHALFSLSLALPSLILWGLGIPFFALIQMVKNRDRLEKLSTKKQYGFLYRGYKKRFFYWEIIIMYRKMVIIAIAVFVRNAGLIVQTLVVLVVIFIFLAMNTELQPYLDKNLSLLESLSLIVSLLTFYIAIFFIINKSNSQTQDNQDAQDYSVHMSNDVMILLYSIILIANLIFFIRWLKSLYEQLKSKLRSDLPKLYICFCLCGNQRKYLSESLEYDRYLQNQNNLERFNYLINSVQNLLKNGDICLDEVTIKNLSEYFQEDKIISLQKRTAMHSAESILNLITFQAGKTQPSTFKQSHDARQKTKMTKKSIKSSSKLSQQDKESMKASVKHSGRQRQVKGKKNKSKATIDAGICKIAGTPAILEINQLIPAVEIVAKTKNPHKQSAKMRNQKVNGIQHLNSSKFKNQSPIIQGK